MRFDLISSEQVYAEVRENLSSYFTVGAMDDLLFDRWTSDIMSKFGRSVLNKKYAAIPLHNKKGELPENTKYVDEVWSCDVVQSEMITLPTFVLTTKTYTIDGDMEVCNKDVDLGCSPCSDATYTVYTKDRRGLMFRYKSSRRMYPSDYSLCMNSCRPKLDSGPDSYQIVGNSIYTVSDMDVVHMVYYEESRNEEGELMIPDDVRLKDVIINYITMKLYKKLYDNTSDESVSTLRVKYSESKLEYNMSYTAYDTWLKKQTKSGLTNSINNSRNRFDKIRQMHK